MQPHPITTTPIISFHWRPLLRLVLFMTVVRLVMMATSFLVPTYHHPPRQQQQQHLFAALSFLLTTGTTKAKIKTTAPWSATPTTTNNTSTKPRNNHQGVHVWEKNNISSHYVMNNYNHNYTTRTIDIPNTTTELLSYPYVHPHIIQSCGLQNRFAGANNTLKPLSQSLGYIKTHKTGSSTLANLLNRIVEGRNLTKMIPDSFVNLGWPNPFPGKFKKEENNNNNTKYNVIDNHAVFNHDKFQHYLKQPAVMFTVLRDPVERAISSFNYNQKFTSWDQFFHQYHQPHKFDRRKYLNEMTLTLGWTKGHDQINLTEFQQFLERLDRQLDVVLLLEHLPETLLLLREEVPELELTELIWCNKKTADEKIRPTNAQLQELQHLLQLDILLYNHFKRKMLRQWEQLQQSYADSDNNNNNSIMRQKEGLVCLHETITAMLNDNNTNVLPKVLQENLERDSKEYTKLQWSRQRQQQKQRNRGGGI